MKNTINSKIILVALAVVFAFGVIAIMPESANASYGYSGGSYSGGYYDVGGSNYYGSNFYGSYSNSVYIPSLAGPQSPWYPSIIVPIESQTFFMEQTWRRYGFSSSDFNYGSGSNYNSHYSSSNFGNTRGGYGY